MSELTPYLVWWTGSGLATSLVCAWLWQRPRERRLAAGLAGCLLLLSALTWRLAEEGAARDHQAELTQRTPAIHCASAARSRT